VRTTNPLNKEYNIITNVPEGANVVDHLKDMQEDESRVGAKATNLIRGGNKDTSTGRESRGELHLGISSLLNSS